MPLKELFAAVFAIASFSCLHAQQAVQPEDNPIKEFYYFANMEHEKLDSNSQTAMVGSVKSYFASYNIELTKGQHIYLKLTSFDEAYLVLRSDKTNIDTTFMPAEKKILGVDYISAYTVEESDKYTLYVVNGDGMKPVEYSLGILNDRLFKNSIPASATLCNRIQSLLDYGVFGYIPLKGKLLEEKPDMFTKRREFATNYELVAGQPLRYVTTSTPPFLFGKLYSYNSKEDAVNKLQQLKQEITACFSSNDKIIIEEENSTYNENLPQVDVKLKKSKYLTERLFYLQVNHSKDGSYSVDFYTSY